MRACDYFLDGFMRAKRTIAVLLTTFFYTWIGFTAVANTTAVSSYNVEQTKVSGDVFSASLSSTLVSNSNLYRLDDNAVSSNSIEVSPTLFFQNQFDSSRIFFNYQGSQSFEGENSDDNQFNHQLAGKYSFQVASKSQLFLSGSYIYNSIARGTDLTRGNYLLIDATDEKRNAFANLGFQYGNDSTVSKLVALVGTGESRYMTRQEVTDIYNLERQFASVDFDYLFSGKTFISLKVELEQQNYENSAQRDNDQTSIFAGVTWRGNDAISAHVLLGVQKISLEEVDDDGFSWRVGLNWRPVDYVKWSLTSARRFQSANFMDQLYQSTETTRGNFQYQFSNRALINVSLAYQRAQLVSTSQVIDESLLTSGISFVYPWLNTLSLLASFDFNSVDSDIVFASHDIHLVKLGISYAF